MNWINSFDILCYVITALDGWKEIGLKKSSGVNNGETAGKKAFDYG